MNLDGFTPIEAPGGRRVLHRYGQHDHGAAVRDVVLVNGATYAALHVLVKPFPPSTCSRS